MPVRERLQAILRGTLAADLDPEARHGLETLAADAQSEGLLVHARDECAARLRQAGASPAVSYLLAALCAMNGEIERANQTLLALGEKLAAAKSWEALAAVADRSLDLERTGAGARLLVRAHEGLAVEPARIEALQRAWEILPDDLDLGLLLAVRLLDVGRAAERRALLAELTPRFAEDKRYAGLEEAALEFAEHDDLDGLLRLVRVVPMVAAQGATAEAKQLVDIAVPRLVAAGRAGEMLDALRATVTAAAAAGEAAVAQFRAAVIEALRQGPGRDLPDAERVLDDSAIASHETPLLEGLERFDLLAALPPGRSVFHGSFGGGRIVSNDGETVAIDFAKSRGHRMPYAAARRSLATVADTDLRLLHLSDPAELARMRADAPGEFLVRALQALGGSADAQKLKVFLVGYHLVPAGEWTSFFRRLKSAGEKDPRVDHARAFEQVWALAAEGGASSAEVQAPLPALEPRKPAKANLATLRKFLAQHPGAEAALAQRFGKFVERTMLDPDAEAADRARAGLRFARWFPGRAAEWADVLRALWEQGLSVTDLTGEDEQVALLEGSHAAGVEMDAILSALDSRFASVREAAQRHREQLDAAGRMALRRTLIDHAPRYPAAALRLVDDELTAATPPADAWRLLWAALSLIEDRPKPSVAEKVLGWIEEGGPFHRWLAHVPCPEDYVLKMTVLLRQWRSSDRYLFPALEAATRFGLREAVDTVRAHRQKQTDKLFDQVGQQADVELSVMTRATWQRLKRELERMERELRTTIPATIQKARELGDLRENAEYHSAKLKQANVSKQVAALQLRLTRARFVDDAELKDGVVGLGTEIVLESDREVTTYWILGEGEHHHGEHVISFQSTVGRALMGKGIGDEVELGEGDERRRHRIVSLEHKLPPSEAPTTVERVDR